MPGIVAAVSLGYGACARGAVARLARFLSSVSVSAARVGILRASGAPGEGEQNWSSDGCVQVDRPENTLKAFRVIEKTLLLKDRSSFYQDLIYKFCSRGQVCRALDLLEEMVDQKLFLTSSAFTPILRIFSRELQLDEALETLAAMRRLKIQPTIKHYNAVINASTRAGNMEKACGVLVELQQHGKQPNTESFNYIIRGFGRQGRFKMAKSVLRDIDQAGLKPNIETYYYLLQACTASQDFNAAMKLIKEMRDQGLEPNELVSNVMGCFLVGSGKIDHALELVKQMELNIEDSGLGLKNRILGHFARAGRLEEADKVYKEIRTSGKGPNQPSALMFLAACGKAGRLDRMVEIFEESVWHGLHSKGWDRNCSSYLTVSCCHVVLSFVHHKQLGRAAKFLQRIADFGIRNYGVLVDKVFIHLASSGASVDSGLAVLKSIRALGIQPSRIALEALLDCCTSSGSASKALEIVQEMEKECLPLNIFTNIRLFQIFVATRNEIESLRILDLMSSMDLKDPDVQFLILRILQLNGLDKLSKTTKVFHEQVHWRLAACR